MANTEIKKRKSSLGRKLGIIAGSLLAFLIVLYLVVTSSAFFKGVILPRAGASMQAKLTVESASVSPFSQIILRKLQVQTTGAEPLLSADEAKVRYSLSSILRGNIEVHELSLTSPTIRITQEADGRSNLDPILQSQKGKPAPPSTSAKPLQLAVKNVTIKNGTIHTIKKAKDGSTQTTELGHAEVTLDQLQNGQPGKLTLATEFKMQAKGAASAQTATDALEGKVTGTFDFGLDPKLMPQTVKGNARLDVSKADGAFKDLAGLSGTFQADMTPTELRQLALRFERNGQSLGQIIGSGPLDLAKTEGRLNLAIQSIDRQVLNLAGANMGWDFGATTLNATNLLELSKGGSVILASGRIAGRQFSLRKGNQATPALDLDLDYQVNADLQKKTAVVQTLGMTGQQGAAKLISAALDRPMNLSWGSATNGLPDSTFQLTLSQLNLGSWQAMLGTNVPSGRLDLQLNVQAQQEGKLLTVKLAGGIQDLAAKVGTNAIEHAEFKFGASGSMKEFRMVDLSSYQFELLQKNRAVAKGNGSAQYDLLKNEINFQTDAEASLAGLLQQFPQPGINISNGVAKVKTTFTQKEGKQTAIGNFQLTDFNGAYGDYRFPDLNTALDFNLEIERQLVQIRRASLAFRRGTEASGTLELSGQHHLTNLSSQISFKLTDLNQNLLRSLLAPALGDTKLVSISVNGSGSVQCDPKGDSTVKAEWNIANWVVDDPKKQISAVPISGRLGVEGSLRQPNFELRQLQLDLRQGNDSAGHVEVTGRGNVTNYAGQINFKVADLNQIILRPALASALGQNKLVSVALNGSGSASYDPKGDSSVKADVKISNLVAEDPQQTLPRTPLSAQLQLDGSLRQQILDLRQFIVSLSPTPRAQNQLQVQGRLDLNKTNATPSQISLKSESLDLTPYYDLFAVKTASKTTPSASKPAPGTTKTEPAPSPQGGEPAAIDLPFQQLTADMKVDRLYLREVAITNFQTTAKINRGVLTLKPFQMTLNGAPVSAEGVVNVSVPGFTYDVTLQADKVPMEPMANSFATNSTGQYKGELIARAQIKGAGVTGTSLQKNLSGNVTLSLTNLNLTIAGKKLARLLEPISLLLRVPELTQTPLNWAHVHGEIGQGTIKVSQLAALSHAFHATGEGTVRIADVLTNSPVDIPVNIALRRSLAEKANLAPANASTNAYVTLPTFAKLTGTLGNVETKTDRMVISGMLLRSVGNIPQVGEKAGGILQGIGGLLSGQNPSPGTTNNVASTNAPSATKTNKPAKFNPLDLLRAIPEKK